MYKGGHCIKVIQFSQENSIEEVTLRGDSMHEVFNLVIH